jgi:3-hydroxyisobutyrate dehydrogenase-like beta-hydroxyacid dehydrogenase
MFNEETDVRVAVIGLGQMGRAMAERLLARGFEVRVWNRTRDRAEGLKAVVCETAADAARGSELVLTSLASDDAVHQVVFAPDGVLAGLGEGAVHVGTSTISHQFAAVLARSHEAHGRGYVSAPVLGRPDAATAGKLFIFAGGSEPARQHCQPVFEALGQRTFDFPEAPVANLMKICANLMLAGTIELLGEVIALGEKGGLAPQRTVETLTGTVFGCSAVDGYGRRIVEGKFEPAGFRMALGLKDVELALGAGDELRMPLPAANVVRDHLLAALARGLESLDWAGLTRVVRAEAGLQ